jgi:hypothetical protein
MPNASLLSFRRLHRQLGLPNKELERQTEISRQTWGKLLVGATPIRLFHQLALTHLQTIQESPLSQKKAEDGPHKRWQRLPFPVPVCNDCGSRMQRVRREERKGETLYAWRCVKARQKKCSSARIWTNSNGHQISRPAHPARWKNVGVARPNCSTCGHSMHFIKKWLNDLFGQLWKWRCCGPSGRRHRSVEVLTTFSGNKVQLPHQRHWGNRLLPFERARIKALPTGSSIQRRMDVLERCRICGGILLADRRGKSRWRLYCKQNCGAPYFVDGGGKRVKLERKSQPRVTIPKAARKCPNRECRKFLTLGGNRWRNRGQGHRTSILQLICVEDGKRRHEHSTFYYDLSKKKFLSAKAMRSGQPQRACPVRRSCCGRPMWASVHKATAREPQYWLLACANSKCERGRGGKRKYLKVGLDGRCLPWLKKATSRSEFSA